jgi:hypothetical protein
MIIQSQLSTGVVISFDVRDGYYGNQPMQNIILMHLGNALMEMGNDCIQKCILQTSGGRLYKESPIVLGYG